MMWTLPKSWLVLCLTMLAFCSAAWGADTVQRPSFNGTWLLDLAASDPMDAILEAQGRSRMERMMVKNMSVTQRITQTENQITIVVESIASNQTDTLLLDGTIETKETPRAGTVQTFTVWDSDGKTLVTTVKMKLKDDSPADMIMRRQLIDEGKTMSMKVELHQKDGKVLTANRILRKAS